MINLNYGRDRGDNAIKEVADKLVDSFRKENVYRIMGDQFTIIITGNNYENVLSKLAAIKDSLSSIQINISYGLAIGRNCDDLGQMVKVAEENEMQMKSGAGNGFSMSSIIPDSVQKGPIPEDNEPAKKEYSPDDPEDVSMDEMLMGYLS